MGRDGQPVRGDRRQHRPVRVQRLHPDRRAFRPARVRRAGHLRQHQRPARQGPANQAAGGRHVHDPEGQPVRAGHRQDPARDLRDGHAQPVPDHRRPASPTRCWSPTTARTRRPPTRTADPRGRSSSTGSPAPATTAGRTASATTSRSTTTTSRPSTSRAEVQLRRAGQQLAQQHRPDEPAGRARRTGLVRLLRLHPVPGGRHRRWRPDGRPGLRLRPGQHAADEVSRVLRGQVDRLRADPQVVQDAVDPPDRADVHRPAVRADQGRRPPVDQRRLRRTSAGSSRSRRSSGRTARSTSSTSAPAPAADAAAPTRAPASTASTTSPTACRRRPRPA